MTENENQIIVPDEEKQTITPVVPTVQNEPNGANEPEVVTGTVVGCRRLNVREQMNTEAEVLCVLRAGTVVQVVADEVHDDWYHVFTSTGIEGFCMKKYISVNQ
jgi:hypothetical protein